MISTIRQREIHMEYSIELFNDDTLRKYGKFLLANISMAESIPFRSVLIGGLPPKKNECHFNARTYTIENTGYGYKDGWLCMDGGGKSPLMIFAAHTIVQSNNGSKFDVTPYTALDPPLFLPSFLDEESFERVCNFLYQSEGKTTFMISK